MEKKSITEAIEFNESKFTKRILFKEGENTVFILNFLPGQALPTHTHPGSDLFLHVLDGEGTLIINGNETNIRKNDVIYATGDEEFSFKNNSSESVSLYVTLCKIPNEQYAKEI